MCQLLQNKEDISQYGTAKFLNEHLNSVCQGTLFSFGNSASSKPPLKIGHHSYWPAGDASELWAKMVLSECWLPNAKWLPLWHKSTIFSGETEIALEKVPTNV